MCSSATSFGSSVPCRRFVIFFITLQYCVTSMLWHWHSAWVNENYLASNLKLGDDVYFSNVSSSAVDPLYVHVNLWVCFCVCGQYPLNDITFDLDIWHTSWPWCYLGHVWSSRTQSHGHMWEKDTRGKLFVTPRHTHVHSIVDNVGGCWAAQLLLATQYCWQLSIQNYISCINWYELFYTTQSTLELWDAFFDNLCFTIKLYVSVHKAPIMLSRWRTCYPLFLRKLHLTNAIYGRSYAINRGV